MGTRPTMTQKRIEEMGNDVYMASHVSAMWREDAILIAEKLYNAGYRKQSDGEWKEFSDEYGIATHFVCSKCKADFVSSELTDKEFLEMMKFCPNCGADMGGGE